MLRFAICYSFKRRSARDLRGGERKKKPSRDAAVKRVVLVGSLRSAYYSTSTTRCSLNRYEAFVLFYALVATLLFDYDCFLIVLSFVMLLVAIHIDLVIKWSPNHHHRKLRHFLLFRLVRFLRTSSVRCSHSTLSVASKQWRPSWNGDGFNRRCNR